MSDRIQALKSSEYSFAKKPQTLGKHNVLLVYPEAYEVGIGNLGHQIVWEAVNSRPDWCCDRIYHTLGSGRQASFDLNLRPDRFDIIAFPLYYELNLIHVWDFLKTWGLAFEAADRPDDVPLILAGGPLTDITPVLVSRFADIAMLGDAELLLPPFFDALETFGCNKKALVSALAGKPGYMTFGVGAVDRVQDGNPGEIFPLLSPLVSPFSTFSNTALIEIARGCPHHCTFCHIGSVSKPFRPVNTQRILSWLRQVANDPTVHRAGLVSAAVGGHPQIDDICRFATSHGVNLTFSSIRAEDVTPTMLETLVHGGTKTLTLAPEAGSARLRKLLGKHALTEDVLLQTVRAGASQGMNHIKLYVMVGLPTETEEDITDLISLIIRTRQCLLEESKARGTFCKFSVNASIYVPKPGSPLYQVRHTVPDMKTTKKSLRMLEKGLMRTGGILFRPPSSIEARIQSSIAEGSHAFELVSIALALGGNWREAFREWKRLYS